jgi:hypothetical protein
MLTAAGAMMGLVEQNTTACMNRLSTRPVQKQGAWREMRLEDIEKHHNLYKQVEHEAGPEMRSMEGNEVGGH